MDTWRAHTQVENELAEHRKQHGMHEETRRALEAMLLTDGQSVMAKGFEQPTTVEPARMCWQCLELEPRVCRLEELLKAEQPYDPSKLDVCNICKGVVHATCWAHDV